MHKVIFKAKNGEDVTVFAVGSETILDLAQNAGIPIDAPCSGNGTCGKCHVKIIEENTESLLLACQKVVSNDTVVIVPDTATNYINDIIVEYMANHPASSHEGLAIDIGTTTVSALLVDMNNGDKLAKATTGNAQIRYGADVINRIIEQQKPEGVKKLQDAIVKDTLIPLIDKLCEITEASKDKIARLTVAANTTMNHLLLGVDANSIRLEPYEPAFLEFNPRDPAEIGIKLAPDAKMLLAPNIGSYVGGDITAGVLGAGVPAGSELMTLLIDLGTNGEIVFGNNEFMMACACSAGPAFEGGEISCGMRATDGAIEACKIDKNTLEPVLTVIGNSKPTGLCGTGLIDVIAELFKAGIIDGKGKFTAKQAKQGDGSSACFVLATAEDSATGKDISITETDIDNFIRAKGAIFSGIISLLTPLGLTPSDIENVYIAGGIGSTINIKNAISIGMLPDLPLEKYSYLGNTALTGAYSMLMQKTDAQALEAVNEIARNMTYVDLSSEPNYMNEFIAACFLPHTDSNLFPSNN